MTDQTDPTGKTYEARIRGLLELLGYRVQHDRLVAGRQTDLVAVKDVFPGRLLYLVECKDYSRPVGVDVISDAENRLKAARGIDGRQYPWGDGFDQSRCNTDESGIGKTTPVGKHSPFWSFREGKV
ncbi:MAG TPA: hypothetical protein EYP49_16510 [Anaerolineae bacterium]|nr:hypothetical protein [Anaerolineae bacterium]